MINMESMDFTEEIALAATIPLPEDDDDLLITPPHCRPPIEKILTGEVPLPPHGGSVPAAPAPLHTPIPGPKPPRGWRPGRALLRTWVQ